MEVTDIKPACYEAIRDSPQMLLGLINKYVKIELIKNTIICGYIHSIDPIQHSIIILEANNEKFDTNIIPGHAILNVTEMKTDLQPPKQKTLTSTTENNLERKQKLISWLKLNLLPVTESDENIVFGSVIILPPYNLCDICTDNPIVAMQIQNIMSKMPDN